jgi:hypothetical protein
VPARCFQAKMAGEQEHASAERVRVLHALFAGELTRARICAGVMVLNFNSVVSRRPV